MGADWKIPDVSFRAQGSGLPPQEIVRQFLTVFVGKFEMVQPLGHRLRNSRRLSHADWFPFTRRIHSLQGQSGTALD